MCKGCEQNIDWWKEAKATSIKRKRHEASSRKLAQLGDTFLVVTEGKVTEPVYFEFLLSELQLYAVHVMVLPGRDSDPRHVIETAVEKVKDHARRLRKGEIAVNEPQRFDHVWAVIDTDVAVRKGFWNEVKQLAAARKVKLAHSTPCFEYWLLLHLQDTTRGDLVDGDTAKRAVKKALGHDYSTNEAAARKAMPCFIRLWTDAVQHAKRVRQYHIDAATPAPANPSTEVDHLIRALNDSAPEHSRKKIS
jgi:hypothetical protein